MINIYKVGKVFWAKKQESNGYYQWLPLGQHLEDTRKILGALWELWLSVGQKKMIINSLSIPDEKIAKQLTQLLGAIHDIGKATPAFQIKKGYQNTPDLDKILVLQLENYGFKDLSYKILPDINVTPHATAGQVILEKLGVNRDIASIVGGHHGVPLRSEEDINYQKSFINNYFQEEKGDIYDLWNDEQVKILNHALEICGFKTPDELPMINQSGQILLSGLLIMADWIASNTRYFPLLELETVNVDQQKRFENGWKKWFSTFPVEFQTKTSEYLYQNRFDFEEVRIIQKEFANIIEESENPGIFILEAPMAVGKTEAALIGSELLAEKTGRSGVFFGLPTQATSDSLFQRIENWLKKVSLDYDNDVSIQLVHGKSALNPNFQNLAQQINIDEMNNSTVQVNQWFTGRKTSNLDDFVIGTVDQFLMIALKQKHLVLRHLGFSKKVVIIDEVHAYDSYMNQYLYQALKWMGTYGVPVIILSATLPTDRRISMIQAYLDGAGISGKEFRKNKANLLNDAYPLITYTDGYEIKQKVSEPSDNTIKIIKIHRIQDEDLIVLLDDWMSKTGIIGIIVNTVRRAQELGRKFSEKYGEKNVDILHSSFVDTERKKKERLLLDQIGKGNSRPQKHLYIGTQVMEQSLDIDFDVLVTDLAPMDLIIQRIGRLHRHKRSNRSEYHKIPEVYILGTDSQYQFEPGSSAVYGDYLLIRTQELLPEVLKIPTDISPLVQATYGELELIIRDELLDIYLKAQLEHERKLKNKKEKAKSYLLDSPPRKHKTIMGWLNNTHPNVTEEYGYAQVRDSNETIEVILLKKIDQGYSLLEEERDVSLLINDSAVAKKIAQSTVKLPGILTHKYNIEKTIKVLENYYIKYLSNWDQQPWLKGQLGIILDENNEFKIGNFIITYDSNYGLSMRKEGENGTI